MFELFALTQKQKLKKTKEAIEIGLLIHDRRQNTNTGNGLGSSLDSAREKNSRALSHVEPLVFEAIHGRLPTIEDAVIPGDVFKHRRSIGLRPCDVPIKFEHRFTDKYDDVMGYEIKSCKAGMNLVADKNSVTYKHDLLKPFVLYHDHDNYIEPVGFRFGFEVAQKWNTVEMWKDPGYFVRHTALHPINELPSDEALKDLFTEAYGELYTPTKITNFKDDCEACIDFVSERISLTRNLGFYAAAYRK